MIMTRNRMFGSLAALGLWTMAACQAQQKPQEVAVATQPTAAAVDGDASEGVVGPDEAFFAEYYLEQVFQASEENGNPILDSGSVLTVAPHSVSAFDFNANFTEARVQLMVKALFTQGDSDSDGALSEAEFGALKLDPGLLGNNGDRLGHSFESSFFLRLAGEDEWIQPDECAAFLRNMGQLVKVRLDKLSAQEQRRSLVKAWETVLARYDADQSGALSLAEQRELRKDRAQITARLTDH